MLNVDPSKRPTLESVLQDPFFHVHLQRYFRDRFSGDKVSVYDNLLYPVMIKIPTIFFFQIGRLAIVKQSLHK
jgi:hypothetical protein